MTTIDNTLTGLGRRQSIHQRFIAETTVANVLACVKPPTNRDLVDLPSTATMEEAFDVLLAQDILSIPVYHLDGDTKQYITIVSVLDLLRLLSGDAQDDSTVLLKPLSEAIGMTPESSTLVTVRPTDSLEYVIQLLSSHRTHRVLVQSSDHSPVLLSQMDVARYLQAQNHKLGSVLDLTIPSIVEHATLRRHTNSNGSLLTNASSSNNNNGEEAHVLSIPYRLTAKEAFAKLATSSVGALAIVEPLDNTLVAELSPEHLRGLNRNRFNALQRPVIMYIKEHDGDLYPPLTCHDRFTLSQVLTAFVLRQAHRLWWCDGEGHVKGVITLSDLLGTFLDQMV